VKFGVHIFATDESIAVDRLAREAEERGFESLWLPEHTHIPTSRESEWYRGRDLPREYLRTLDPFIALTVAASVTSRLRVATGICLVAQHDPITLAKQVATLDQVSRGRFILGVGLGWNLEEMRDHGVEPTTRRSHVREKLLAMRGLWTQDTFGFQGDHVRFEETWQWPKPVQAGGPPVILGGRGTEKSFRHIAEYADGWLPDLSMMRPERLPEQIAQLGDAVEAAGRVRGAVTVTAQGLGADPQQIVDMAELGVDRCVFLLASSSTDEVLSDLETFHGTIEKSGVLQEQS
jgi:probable F420-dependent oxidoreductase